MQSYKRSTTRKYKNYLQKYHAAVYDVRVQKHNTITTGIEKYGEPAKKLFSWALVRQVAT